MTVRVRLRVQLSCTPTRQETAYYNVCNDCHTYSCTAVVSHYIHYVVSTPTVTATPNPRASATPAQVILYFYCIIYIGLRLACPSSVHSVLLCRCLSTVGVSMCDTRRRTRTQLHALTHETRTDHDSNERADNMLTLLSCINHTHDLR